MVDLRPDQGLACDAGDLGLVEVPDTVSPRSKYPDVPCQTARLQPQTQLLPSSFSREGSAVGDIGGGRLLRAVGALVRVIGDREGGGGLQSHGLLAGRRDVRIERWECSFAKLREAFASRGLQLWEGQKQVRVFLEKL